MSFLVCTVLVHVLAGLLFDGLFFPTWRCVLVLLPAPLIGFLAASVIVAVSGRSTTVQGAQGASVPVVLPVLALVLGQATGLPLFDVRIALAASAAVLLVDLAVFRLAVRSFAREPVITRL
ncbi:hypothetical protein [Actinocorallia herbida]|uniref:hypothetical protein n=1 Tax=Actinocorallia herbida TaxID=58109 RepID=UPI000F4C8647|nr:hypothetical protein [Actinocorallia herbida]